MRSLKPLWHLWLSYYYRWALSEIHPTHPDVPFIVTRLSELSA